MGKGIDMARADAPEHAALMDDFKDQFIIVALKRLEKLGDNLVFPLAEVDDTGQDMLAFRIDEQKNFIFVLEKKE
jgi:hypothetical protein